MATDDLAADPGAGHRVPGDRTALLMRREVRIVYSGDEVSYSLVIGIVMRQLARGQVYGDGVAGNGTYHYEVTTDHREERKEDE